MSLSTVNDLILKSLLLIGEWNPNEIVEPQYIFQGLDWLNLIIDSLSQSGALIPLYYDINFTAVSGVSDYTISNVPGYTPSITGPRLASIEYCNILFNQLSWPVTQVTETEIYTNTRYTGLQQRPCYILLRKFVDHSLIKFFPAPDMNYQCELRIKPFLDEFSINTPITTVPLHYQYYLIHCLAKKMVSVFPSASWSDSLEMEYQKLEDQVKASNQIDYTIITSQLLESYRRNDYSLLQVT